MKTALVILVLASLLLASTAWATCQYCGSRLICEGDSIATLLERCGAPLMTREVGLETREYLGHKTTQVVEQWFYQNPYGSIKAFRTYTIVGGKIVRIE
ncbi:MAG: DUF2845 domain-containing protein [Nitrospinota bacterium]|nr:MAG: DUF2845 domain-containing protein [Nitrospinota bacterium]